MSEGLPGTADEQDVARDPDEATPAPAAAAPEEPTAKAPAEEPAVKGLRRRRRIFGNARIAWGVALLALAFAAFAGTQWADLYGAEQEREDVREAARELALRLTTFEGENIEEWYSTAVEQATGEYRQQLTEVFDQRNRDALREIEVASQGEVENLFVQEVSGDTASAFAVVQQTYVNSSTPDPVEDQLRIDMKFQRVEGEWLGSEVAVLGPPGALAPTGDPTEAAPDAGDQ